LSAIVVQVPNRPPNPDASFIALGRAVRALRLESNMSQEHLAREMDVHPTYISRIEAGRRNVSWGTVLRISRALGVSLSQFVQTVDEMEKAEED
jgi:transcriptional regulator with XRE-family HTH domain